MNLEISGIGKKRPQVDIPLSLINLDNENPRIEEEGIQGDEFSLIKHFYLLYDLEGLAYSMSVNGYFDEEPIIVVPKNLPKEFKFIEDIEKMEVELNNLIENKKISFKVIEGNRRIASAKLLASPELRKRVGIRSFPEISEAKIKEDLKSIPSIVYRKKEEVFSYLGIKHIEGPLKWGAYSKAKYIAKMIENERESNKDVNKCVKIVQGKIADRSDVIKKQYISYRLFEEVRRESLDINFKDMINRFSLVGEILNRLSIRDFIEIPSYNEINFDKNFISKKNVDKIEMLLIWVFGNESNRPIITDSRKIKILSAILTSQESTNYFIKYENLEDAFERSRGEKEFLLKKLEGIKNSISLALGILFKFKKDKEVSNLIEEIKEGVHELIKSKND